MDRFPAWAAVCLLGEKVMKVYYMEDMLRVGVITSTHGVRER